MKEEILPEWVDGASWKEVSNLYGIPGGTVKAWQGEARRAA